MVFLANWALGGINFICCLRDFVESESSVKLEIINCGRWRRGAYVNIYTHILYTVYVCKGVLTIGDDNGEILVSMHSVSRNWWFAALALCFLDRIVINSLILMKS